MSSCTGAFKGHNEQMRTAGKDASMKSCTMHPARYFRRAQKDIMNAICTAEQDVSMMPCRRACSSQESVSGVFTCQGEAAAAGQMALQDAMQAYSLL